uniref:Pituitary tumor-transforming 1 interacting protein n=1 Tax=Mus musculus TaxID=10090 RepID=E0CXX2_MOUSE
MAPANLGLTPHWVMLLGAVLLLLLSGASAQEPPRVDTPV